MSIGKGKLTSIKLTMTVNLICKLKFNKKNQDEYFKVVTTVFF